MPYQLIDRKFNYPFLYMFTIFSIAISFWLFFVSPIALYFGLFGCFVNIFMDYGIWYHVTKIRVIEGIKRPFFFFLMFMFYGITQFSYAIVLFEGNPLSIFLFTVFDFVVLTLIGELAKRWGREITVSRKISDKHWISRILFVFVLYSVIYIVYGDLFLILRLFLYGIIVGASLEIPLLINRTRTFYPKQLILGLLFEFNLGIPILYLAFHFFT